MVVLTICGKPFKADFSGDSFNPLGYEQCAGGAKAQVIIDKLRAQKTSAGLRSRFLFEQRERTSRPRIKGGSITSLWKEGKIKKSSSVWFVPHIVKLLEPTYKYASDFWVLCEVDEVLLRCRFMYSTEPESLWMSSTDEIVARYDN